MMQLRALNEEGIRKMGDFLDSLTTDSPLPTPIAILSDPNTSLELTPGVEIDENRTFMNRFDAAQYFFNTFDGTGLRGIDGNRGIWAWLALVYFDQLCPKENSGVRRQPGQRARWIPEPKNDFRYYRHLFAGPYFAYRAHAEDPTKAMALLGGRLDRPGDVVEQIVSRAELVTTPSVVEVATRLYWNDSEKKYVRGSQSKGKGSVRRYADVLAQFDVTWDLRSMDADQLFMMLPDEFERFRMPR